MADRTATAVRDRNESGTRILVCLSTSPSSQRVIRAAAKLAGRNSEAMALYVSEDAGDIPANSKLYANIQYARSLGFEIDTAQSNDIALTISEYAKRNRITDLFLGYTAPSHLLINKKTISEQLVDYLPETDIHIIPDTRSSSFPLTEKKNIILQWYTLDFVNVLIIMGLATLISYWFYTSRFSNANIITIYILAVLISSLLTSHRLYGILAAVLYILLFNFLFIEPRFTLLVYDAEYLVTYLVSFIAALITGSVTSQMKNIARTSAENAYQAKVLLDTSNQLERASGSVEIIRIACMQLVHLLNRTVLFFRGDDAETMESVYPAADQEINRNILRDEAEAVKWTIEHSHHSGAFTSHFGNYRYRYYSIHSGDTCYGVIGIDMAEGPFSEFENTILLSILNEFTMALEYSKLEQERKAAEIAAENERLRAGLLRSISHDLRTPMTSILGNASNLAERGDALSEEDRKKIYDDLVDDSEWLNGQMENILVMTKLENSHYLNTTVENIDDVITESLRHIHDSGNHPIRFVHDEDDCFARMDSKLILQVLVNLLNNAVKYTPEGSEIVIRRTTADSNVLVSVEDNGNGIPDADKEHVFELFYTGTHRLADSYRSMGIGLNLCQMIIRMHNGTIEVYDNKPHGTVIRFSLPMKEVSIDERL